MSKILQLVIARAKEPSTLASLAVVFSALGFNVSDQMMSAIMGIVGGAAALAGIFVSEKGSS